MPTIVIENESDLAAILKWRDEHKDYVRNYTPIIREGVIAYGTGYKQEFRFLNDDIVRHEYLAGGILKGFGFEYNRRTWKIMNKYGIVTFFPIEKAIEDMITVHATCMAILQYASQYVHKDGEKLIIKITEGRERDG